MLSKMRRRNGTPPPAPWNVTQSACLFLTDNEKPDWREPVRLAEVRPTQMAVGMRSVEVKRRKIERHVESSRKLRRFLERRPVPAVLGPGEDYYIIDHHHLSLALWQSEVDEVFVCVVGDLSDMPKRAFFHAMAALGWLHAYDADGRKICPTRLPATLDQLQVRPLSRSSLVGAGGRRISRRCPSPSASLHGRTSSATVYRQPCCRAILNLLTNEHCASRARRLRGIFPETSTGRD